MKLKIVGGEFKVRNDWRLEVVNPNQDDQSFVDDLKEQLLNNLSCDASGLIEKYGGIYFTGYKDVDNQILGAISHFFPMNGVFCDLNELQNTCGDQSDDKLKKLLYILRNVISKKGMLLKKLPLCNDCKDSLESLLLTFVDKYSMDELKMILYFENITFDFLENLNGFDEDQRKCVLNSIEIFRDELGVELFPICMTKDNVYNIKNNVSYLKQEFPNMLGLFKDYFLNACFMVNLKSSLLDFILLKNSEFKLILEQIDGVDSYFLSISTCGYKYYEMLFDRINNNPGNEAYLGLLRNFKIWNGEWSIFWVDKGLPMEMLASSHHCSFTYEQCSFVYENITKDPSQLKELFTRNFDTILFLYNNITKCVKEIIELYDSIHNVNYDGVLAIYKRISNYEDFSKVMRVLYDDKITGYNKYSVVAFFCEHFKGEVINSLDNWQNSKIYKLESCNPDSIKFLFENGVCGSINGFIDYIDIIKFFDNESLSILLDLFIKNNDYDRWMSLFGRINSSSYDKNYKNEIIHKIGKLNISKSEKYVQICEMFDNSDYSDIRVLKDFLIMDILNSEHPEDIVNKVKMVFMQSHIPLISKILKIFEYVYSEGMFNDKLDSHRSPSHYLQSLNTYEKKLDTVYQDLMHIMIDSGELSLRKYIEFIISNKYLLYDFEKGKELSKDECNQILLLMKMIVSLNLVINDHGSNSLDILECGECFDNEVLKNYYKKLKGSLLIKDSDSMYTFFLPLYKKIGFDSLEDIIKKMNKMQKVAHTNGLCSANLAQNGQFFNSYDNYFLKGIDSDSLGEILDRGVTSTEYLGGGEGSGHSVSSNSTPFDADGIIVKGENVFNVASSHPFGYLALIIDINKAGLYNSDFGLKGYKPNTYEIFKNHGEISDYYGIRTGIASTEFDAIIYMKKEIDIGKLQMIKYLIAKNGFYLPVFDLEKNLLFTPEEYHTLRQGFSFSNRYKGYDVDEKNGEYISSNQDDKVKFGDQEFIDFVKEHKIGLTSNIDSKSMAKLVFDKIRNVLESEFGIQCNYNKNLLGAELYDSGSTGRGTEIPSNDVDLDFTLLLNSQDYEKIDAIQRVIHEKIGTIESNDHSTTDGAGLQMKSIKNSLGGDHGYINGIHFDLLILKKTRANLYPSNVAMQDRFEQIGKTYGKDTLDFVKENIVIMKKLLKSQGTYKNTEGGMGGIGVENWIMQHHGNLIEALEAFENVAYGGIYKEGKTNIPFDEFKNRYVIRDTGHNFKDGSNDNYVLKMNDAGYNGILNIIKMYRKNGIKGILQMLQDYNDIKAQFLK